jgi:uncharacterized protein (TIGR02186 family)
VRKRLFSIWIAMLACLVYTGFSSASTPLEIAVQPGQIFIGATYNGTDISVSGRIPADTEAVIRLTGHKEDGNLKKKGRIMGVLWMNLGSVEFHNIPGVFLLYRSKQIDDRQIRGIGIETVRKEVDIVSEYQDKDALFEEFVKLKQKSGLYSTVENGIHYGKEDNGVKSFSASMKLPSALPQGDYRLEVFALADNGIAGYFQKDLNVKQTGMPAFIATLAFDHGTLYGILSVIVAIIAGLLTGTIFKGERGAH